MPKHSSTLGTLHILAAGIGFGFLGIFGKLAFAAGLNVGELLFWRFATASVLLALILAVARPHALRVSRRQLFVCACLGLFGYAVFSTLYFTAVEGVSASLASLLLYTFPVFVTLGGQVFLGEHVRPLQWWALPLAAIGVFALVWDEIRTGGMEIRSWLAVAAGLGSALAYALYILASRKWQSEISPLTSGFYVISFATLGLFAFHRPDLSRVFSFGSLEVGCIVGLAVISTIGPMILFLSGLQRMNAAAASILSTVEPVTATLLSAIVFNEKLGWRHALGGSGVLSAVVVTVLGAKISSKEVG